MESLTNTSIVEFNADTLQFIRKQYGLDQPDILKEAIDILQEWINKQQHFEVKSFPREYLERIIIYNKGSLEVSKKKLDKLCTCRTLSPDYFEIFDLEDCSLNIITNVLLPKLTPEHYRVHVIKIYGNKFTFKSYYDHFRYTLLIADYQQFRDYCNGVLLLFDFTDADVLQFVLNLNIIETRKFLEIFHEGFSMRVKGLHLLTASKSLEKLIMLFKQVLSAKLNKRVYVHKKIDTIYEHIPKEMLPTDYNGNEKSIQTLHNNTVKELSSTDFIEVKKEMNKCRTNEAHRQADKFNDEYLGMSGTFRNLHVD